MIRNREDKQSIRGFMPMRVLQIVVVVMVCAFPLTAYPQCNATGDIPFTISNNATVKKCVDCVGPWFRDSTSILIDAGKQECTWYAANDILLSPFGQWNCEEYRTTADGQFCGDRADIFVDFCLEDIPGNPGVHLEIRPDDSLQVNFSPPPCPSSVRSFLGDHPDQLGTTPDLDTFLFTGTGGDEVTVRLEADPRAGHNGGTVSLGVRDAGSVALSRATSGTPPLELTATLPATGPYAVEVGQPAAPQRFRGAYSVRIKPTTGSLDRIEPTANVEK
jgi:hypothetical protein